MLDDVRLHQALIGRAGSRAELNTPALVIDRDALDRNIRRMADLARKHVSGEMLVAIWPVSARGRSR